MTDKAEPGLPPLTTIAQADKNLPGELELGAFSLSLSVADLMVSLAFYQKLGFVVIGGDPQANYLILKNGDTTIGLFEGMFEGNILTFNPGLTNRMEMIESFTDVRDIEATLQGAGVELSETVESETTGAGSLSLIDPDGNSILVDQFF